MRSTLATLLVVLLVAATAQAQSADDYDPCRNPSGEDRRVRCDYERREKEKALKLDAAIADVDQAIARKSDDPSSYLLRAELYDKKGDTEKAIADLTRAADLSPDDYRPYFNRVLLYEQTKQYDRAIADFDKLITLFPGDTYYTTRRAELLSKAAASATEAPAAKAPPEKGAEPLPADAQVPKPGATGKGDCRRYDALSNRTISVACPD
jgi:tetratricopeptide (TPR) repeat protein